MERVGGGAWRGVGGSQRGREGGAWPGTRTRGAPARACQRRSAQVAAEPRLVGRGAAPALAPLETFKLAGKWGWGGAAWGVGRGGTTERGDGGAAARRIHHWDHPRRRPKAALSKGAPQQGHRPWRRVGRQALEPRRRRARRSRPCDRRRATHGCRRGWGTWLTGRGDSRKCWGAASLAAARLRRTVSIAPPGTTLLSARAPGGTRAARPPLHASQSRMRS